MNHISLSREEFKTVEKFIGYNVFCKTMDLKSEFRLIISDDNIRILLKELYDDLLFIKKVLNGNSMNIVENVIDKLESKLEEI